MVRRQWLEENPQSSSNDDKVLFDTSTIPWWAWVRRFHLPEAEKLNGKSTKHLQGTCGTPSHVECVTGVAP